MKLGYSSNAYMRWSAAQAVERIAALGYRGIEIMADTPHAWPAETTDEQIDALRRSIEGAGLTISNVNAFMMNAAQDFWHPSWIEPDEAFRRQRVQHTKDALTLARKLGARCITTEPGGPLEQGMDRDRALDTFLEGLREVLEHAEKEDVLLLVEPEPELLVQSAADFLYIASKIDSPMFGLNFDVGHFYCVGEPLAETVQKLAPWTRHYHLEDIAASRIHEHLIPGHGAIDFTEVLGAIADTAYDGWLTVELYPYLDDPDAAGREALKHLASLMPS